MIIEAKLKKPHPQKEMRFEKHLVTNKLTTFDMDESILKSKKAIAWLFWKKMAGDKAPSMKVEAAASEPTVYGGVTVPLGESAEVKSAVVEKKKRGRPRKDAV